MYDKKHVRLNMKIVTQKNNNQKHVYKFNKNKFI